jgi:hypothetical protein
MKLWSVIVLLTVKQWGIERYKDFLINSPVPTFATGFDCIRRELSFPGSP